MPRPRKPDSTPWRLTPAGQASRRASKVAENQRRWERMTPEQRAAFNAEARAVRRTTQARSAQTAGEHRQPWTDADDAVIRANPTMRLRELAAKLGRTIYAVETRRRLLKQHEVNE